MNLAYHPDVKTTVNGTRYLTEAGVAVLSSTRFHIEAIRGFLDKFVTDEGEKFEDYFLETVKEVLEPESATAAAMGAEGLAKFAGQLCYMSFGKNRTRSNAEGMRKYLKHIKESSHGSVLEHPNVSMLFYGIDRSCTHEIVRHRAGMAYSQVSQRYVDGSILRFVERPEWQVDKELHGVFESRIEWFEQHYNMLAETLKVSDQMKELILSGQFSRTDIRKRMNQAARSCLPNETEAPIVVTGNLRSWRHFIEMRCSKFADTPIRRLAFTVYDFLFQMYPNVFNDYTVELLPDFSKALNTPHRKV